jgi:hypothetical protein
LTNGYPNKNNNKNNNNNNNNNNNKVKSKPLELRSRVKNVVEITEYHVLVRVCTQEFLVTILEKLPESRQF